MKKLFCVVFALLIAVLPLCSCEKTTSPYTDEMFALDTIIRFTLYDENEKLCEDTVQLCKDEITRLENLLSISKESSDVYKLNKSDEETVLLSEETAQLIIQACDISKSCDGAFDISVKPLMTLWGFDTKEYKVPSDTEIEDVMSLVSYENVKLDKNTVSIKQDMAVDLGAVAKGYIGDKVLKIINNSGIYSALVDMGGMILCKNVSKSPDEMFWNIGLSYPDDSGECFLKFKNSSPAISTSGGYQRYFESDGVTYHHIIDSKTGKPSKSDISSVTVIDSDGYLCDALSTAFYVMGIDKTVEYLNTHKNVMGDRSLVFILSADKKTLYASQEYQTYNLEPELLKGYEDIEIVYI